MFSMTSMQSINSVCSRNYVLYQILCSPVTMFVPELCQYICYNNTLGLMFFVVCSINKLLESQFVAALCYSTI
jgi:hypothetical protein